MKKKLICIFLSVMMLLSVCLTSCGQEDEEEKSDKASDDAVTLSMVLMSESEVDEDTVLRIEEAVNEITEAKFKTRIKLHFYTEAEYYLQLDAAFAERASAPKLPVAPTDEEDEDENDDTSKKDGLIVYPEIEDYQVDLFYLGGMDNYIKYKEAGQLISMDSFLDTSSKKLTEYVAKAYFDALKANGGVYALPSNRAIGQYTYLLFNKDVLNSLYRTSAGVTSLTDATCQEILTAVKNSSTLSASYVPLWSEVDDLDTLIANLQFIGEDEEGNVSNAFSVVGNFYGKTDILTTSGTQHKMVSNLMENAKFVEALRTLKKYKTEGYYAADENDKRDFAVGVVQGGAELAEVYGDDYEMVVIETPRMTTEDLYGHMMGVSPYSSKVERSMEILTYLNTNVEFRNLLLYGVEGEDYHLIDTKVEKDEFGNTYKVVKRTSQKYLMAPEKTGNTFITYPVQTEDMIYGIHEYGVAQNREVRTGMLLGFSLVYESGNAYVNDEGMLALRMISQEILKDYRAVTDAADAFDAFVAASNQKIKDNALVSEMIYATEGDTPDTCGGKCGSLLCYYKAWLKSIGVVAAT